jgi:hypothetical protein
MLRVLRAFAITAIVVFCLGVLIALIGALVQPRSDRSDTQGPSRAQTPGTIGSTNAVLNQQIASDLVTAGWSEDAARAVVSLNEEWFAIQREENPAGFAQQVSLLGGLGEHRDLMMFLAARPETAGLLASSSDPDLIVESLNGPSEDYELIVGCYVQHSAPTDARALAICLNEDHELICTLKRHGLIGAEVLFVFDRGDSAAREYEAWLRDAVRSKLEGSDEELASFANLVMQQGPEIRKRLRSNPEFLARFRQEFWPALVRVAGTDRAMFELYTDDPRVWDLLALPNGELLLQTSGMLAIDLLYG